MAVKILCISSSPREGSNSDIIADAVIQGARNAGGMVEKVKLTRFSIASCMACNACKKDKELKCAQDDDMIELLDRFMKANAYIFATPIYFFSANSQMKTFLDRMYALVKPVFLNRLRGRKAVVALSYGDKNPYASGAINAVRMFQDMFTFLQMEFMGSVSACCSDPGDVQKNTEVLEQAEALGQRLTGRF